MIPYKVLVTGAAGFIGSHVADHCLRLGMKVVATDDLSGGFLKNVPVDSAWVQGDLRSADFVSRLWQEHGPFDFVYHLAAYAAEGLSHFIRSYNYQTNLVASMHLINEAIKSKTCKCFVFTSSIAVYGKGQLPMSETTVPMPEDPYGISKYAVELDLVAAHEMFELPYIIFRPHNVYGERQNIADKYRNVIGIFMNNLLHGKPMTIFGDGKQSRAFSHVSDVAPIIAQSPLNPRAINQVFNIGADQPYTVNALASEIANAMNKPLDVVHLPARNEVVHAFSDHTKVASIFDYESKIDLKTGISLMVDWVYENGPANPTSFTGIEIDDKLPSGW
jgi:UDP-glucose 4-epimerase